MYRSSRVIIQPDRLIKPDTHPTIKAVVLWMADEFGTTPIGMRVIADYGAPRALNIYFDNTNDSIRLVGNGESRDPCLHVSFFPTRLGATKRGVATLYLSSPTFFDDLRVIIIGRTKNAAKSMRRIGTIYTKWLEEHNPSKS